MPIRHKQHVTPQYYLLGFTECPGSNLIWRYEKGSQCVLETGAKHVGWIRDYYARENADGTIDYDSHEHYLESKIESPANLVIARIRRREAITPEQKVIMAQYVSVMLRRVPHHRERQTKEFAPKVAQSLSGSLDQWLAGMLEKDPSLQDRLEAVRDEMKGHLAEFGTHPPSKLLLPFANDRIAGVIAAMRWCFLTCDYPDMAFATSDNPVFYFEHTGIGRPERPWGEFTLPLSSQVALWATWRTDIVDGYLPAPRQAVKEITRRSVSTATRYVYYQGKADWLLRMVNKPHHQLQNLAGLIIQGSN